MIVQDVVILVNNYDIVCVSYILIIEFSLRSCHMRLYLLNFVGEYYCMYLVQCTHMHHTL